MSEDKQFVLLIPNDKSHFTEWLCYENSIFEFFILDSLNSFLLMPALLASAFFTTLGIIAIYSVSDRPFQVVAAVVKKGFINLISFDIQFHFFLKKEKKDNSSTGNSSKIGSPTEWQLIEFIYS